jgi:hypothetical protein
MKSRVRRLLMSLGVDPSLMGYDYLVEGVILCYKDRKISKQIMKLYSMLAIQIETNAQCVERAIRHAIERACDMCPNIYDKLIVPLSIDSGKYTNSQFISACVEQLKMEDENA